MLEFKNFIKMMQRIAISMVIFSVVIYAGLMIMALLLLLFTNKI